MLFRSPLYYMGLYFLFNFIKVSINNKKINEIDTEVLRRVEEIKIDMYECINDKTGVFETYVVDVVKKAFADSEEKDKLVKNSIEKQDAVIKENIEKQNNLIKDSIDTIKENIGKQNDLVKTSTNKERLLDIMDLENTFDSYIEKHAESIVDYTLKKFDTDVIKHNQELAIVQSEIQKELIRNNNQQIRMSMSIENVETKVIHLVTRITDMYMTTEYINNLNINGTGGVVKFPEITSEVKKKDMIRIYSRFRAQISDELVKDLSLVYKLETIDNESFFISNFVAPIYNDQLKEIINSHREREEEIAREIHENFKMSSEEKRFRDIVEKNKSGYIAAGGDPVEFDALMELNKQAAKDVEEYMNKRKFIDSPLISNKDVVHTEKKLSYSQFIEDFKKLNLCVKFTFAFFFYTLFYFITKFKICIFMYNFKSFFWSFI